MPDTKHKLLLILDLDKTLIHAVSEELAPDFKLSGYSKIEY